MKDRQGGVVKIGENASRDAEPVTGSGDEEERKEKERIGTSSNT